MAKRPRHSHVQLSKKAPDVQIKTAATGPPLREKVTPKTAEQKMEEYGDIPVDVETGLDLSFLALCEQYQQMGEQLKVIGSIIPAVKLKAAGCPDVDRLMGVILAACQGTKLGLLSMMHVADACREANMVPRTIECDAFESAFNWAREERKERASRPKPD